MIWIWEHSHRQAHFKKLFMPKEQISQISPLKRFPRKELVHAEIPKGGRARDFFLCFGLRIISERLADFLIEEETKIQLFPVTVTHADGRIIEGNYFYPHLMSEVDCINQEESEIITTPTGTHWGKLVLDDSKLNGEKLFYIKGLFDVRAVSNDFKKKLKSRKFTGIDFIESSKYLRPYYL